MRQSQMLGISAVMTAATITTANLHDTGSLPNTRQWAGLAIGWTLLSAIGDLGFKPAGGMALLAMTTVILTRGDSSLEWITNLIGSQDTPTYTAPVQTLNNSSTPIQIGSV